MNVMFFRFNEDSLRVYARDIEANVTTIPSKLTSNCWLLTVMAIFHFSEQHEPGDHQEVPAQLPQHPARVAAGSEPQEYLQSLPGHSSQNRSQSFPCIKMSQVMHLMFNCILHEFQCEIMKIL